MENTHGKAVEGTEESMNGLAEANNISESVEDSGKLDLKGALDNLVDVNKINVNGAIDAGVSKHPLDDAEQALFNFVRSELGLGDAGEIVTDERVRQLRDKDYRIAGDLNHPVNYLSNAAVAYAMKPESGDLRKEFWPFDPASFKPSEDRLTELKKAGALILAAIDAINISKLLQKSYNGEGQAVSSQVNHIAYNVTKRTLLVTFASGGSYEYSNVDVQTYIEAYKSDSIGRWINSVLKADTARYTYKKL